MNKVILIGNLGADPDLRVTPSGTSICILRLATSRRWTDAAGERREETEWHQVVVFGKQAELCKEYLSKGRQACVEGRLHHRTYPHTTQPDVTMHITEVIADHVQFLGGNRRNEEEASE